MASGAYAYTQLNTQNVDVQPTNTINTAMNYAIPLGNFTVTDVQIQNGDKCYTLVWQGKDAIVQLRSGGYIAELSFYDGQSRGVTVKEQIAFYNMGKLLLVLYP